MDTDVSEKSDTYIFGTSMRKVEAAGSNRILVQSTRRHTPENRIVDNPAPLSKHFLVHHLS